MLLSLTRTMEFSILLYKEMIILIPNQICPNVNASKVNYPDCKILNKIQFISEILIMITIMFVDSYETSITPY